MFTNNQKSLIVRFSLILALLGGMLRGVEVRAANPQTNTSALISVGETVRVSVDSSGGQGNGNFTGEIYTIDKP